MMKTSFAISVKKPCSEKFDTFNKTTKGGFCSSCEKEVIDFTAMSELELITYFSKSKGKTCGRFNSAQLKTYETNNPTTMNSNTLIRNLGIASFSLLALCTATTTAQETATMAPTLETELSFVQNQIAPNHVIQKAYVLKGKVLDDENLPLSGANVVLKGTAEGVVTDLNGEFEFPTTLKTGDVLVFSYLGYITKEYKVPESNLKTLDVTITFEAADVELMGEIVIGGVHKTKRSVFQKLVGLFK